MSVSVEGHRARMRERAERMNAEAMRPQDLMELILYYALPRRDTKKEAFALIEKFGSVGAALAADESELRSVKGIGAHASGWIKSLHALLESYAQLEATDRPRINNVLRAQAYFRAFFKDAEYPEVWQCCLNAGGRLLTGGWIAQHDAWSEPEYLRGALAAALGSRAHSVVIGQFAPNGRQAFDDYDINATLDYAVTLSAAGIQLLDHMLVKPDGVVSMFAEGRLAKVHRIISSNVLREGYLNANPDDYDIYG
ncbi:MAG: JAB domain-containing protein [Christensenellales bacterium]|jgi:DNA repair protein RadC